MLEPGAERRDRVLVRSPCRRRLTTRPIPAARLALQFAASMVSPPRGLPPRTARRRRGSGDAASTDLLRPSRAGGSRACPPRVASAGTGRRGTGRRGGPRVGRPTARRDLRAPPTATGWGGTRAPSHRPRPSARCATSPAEAWWRSRMSLSTTPRDEPLPTCGIEGEQLPGSPVPASPRGAHEGARPRPSPTRFWPSAHRSVSSPRRRSQAVSASAYSPPELEEALSVLAVLAHDQRRRRRRRCSAEVLRRRMDDHVAARFQRTHVERRRGGRVADHPRGMAFGRLEIRQCLREGIRRRLEPDGRSAPSGGGPVWSNPDGLHSPPAKLAEHDARPVVPTASATAPRPARAARARRGGRGSARREQQRLSAVESRTTLGLGDLVGLEQPREANAPEVLVRPGRRPVDRRAHAATLDASGFARPSPRRFRVRPPAVAEIHDTTEAKLRVVAASAPRSSSQRSFASVVSWISATAEPNPEATRQRPREAARR